MVFMQTSVAAKCQAAQFEQYSCTNVGICGTFACRCDLTEVEAYYASAAIGNFTQKPYGFVET